MKKLVFAVLAMLVLAGNAYSQALSPYERKCLELKMEWLKKNLKPSGELYSTVTKLANAPNNRDKKKKVEEIIGRDEIRFGLGYHDNHRLQRSLGAARILEKSEKYFSQITPKKGEFESTNEFNERLNAFLDSAAYYLKEYALKETESILKILVKDSKFSLDSYNADKGIYAVEAIIDGCPYIPNPHYGGYGWGFYCGNDIKIIGDKVKSTISISPQEAQLLKQAGSTFNINPTDVFWKDYFIYPSKITVTSKADTTKKYVVNFPKPTGASDILFKGSELWANNPKAKNLVYNFKDLAAELSAKQEQQRAEQERIAEEKRLEEERIAEEKRLQEEQERIAEEQRAEKERAEEKAKEKEQKNKEEWAKRVAQLESPLILKLPKGDIRFEMGKPFPFEVLEKNVSNFFEIQGKTVTFTITNKGKSVNVKINDKNVVDIDLKAKQNIKHFRYYYFYGKFDDPFSRLIVKDYLGYGVFDFE